MTQKYRVRVDGKIVAYEWVDDKKGWVWIPPDWPHDITNPATFDGTYPHPGKREAFTGWYDKDNNEIYKGDVCTFTAKAFEAELKHEVDVARATMTPEEFSKWQAATVVVTGLVEWSETGARFYVGGRQFGDGGIHESTLAVIPKGQSDERSEV